ncbi:MAG TPA: M24 family metallopeptidase [Gemmataceae bacterium]|nr:M24 family metallopeptidase [Gemmataceae bacterium]
MSIPSETLVQSFPLLGGPSAAEGPGRRSDIDAKQARLATLLERTKCDGLLILDPDNFAWLTSGAVARSVLDPAALPAVYFSAEQRWLLSANCSSQRLFDEEIDGLGFQLKEWPWHQGREQLLADLCQGRTVACDVPFGNLRSVAGELRLLRRTLTPYEQACLRALGQVVSHALEATCRTMNPGETEREVAGQVSHRLIHRGTLPLQVGVAADGRSRLYRQFGFTSTPVRKYAVLGVTARKYGLYASATRSVSFGPPEDTFRAEHNAACKVGATYLASTWPDALPREILAAGRRVYALTGQEHEWRLNPQGHVTGRAPVELTLMPGTEELFQAGWVVTWNAAVGAARSCDTFLVTDQGPGVVTPTEPWPLKRIRIQGADFVRPDILQR